MIVGIRCRGATADLVRHQLDALTAYCQELYSRDRTLPRVDHAGVRYKPDAASDTIVLVAPDAWQDTVSCGSAAGAYAGWMRSRGKVWTARFVLVDQRGDTGVWHGIATDASIANVWDPMKELPS